MSTTITSEPKISVVNFEPVSIGENRWFFYNKKYLI